MGFWYYGSNSPYLLDADFTALNLGGYSASSFLSATGLTFTRSSTSTVQTSDTTLKDGLATNEAAIGNRTTTPSKTGLVIQQPTFNWLSAPSTTNRDLTTTWISGSGATVTKNYAVGPNGLAVPPDAGCSRVAVTSGGYGPYGSSFPGTRSCFTSWQRSVNPASNGDMMMICNQGAINSNAKHAIRLASNTWARLQISTVGVTFSAFTTVDTRDYTVAGGQAAKARDVQVDYVHLEAGDFPTEAHPSNSRREGDKISVSNGGTLVATDGQIRFYAKFSPKHASSMQVYYNGSGSSGTSAGWYLFSWGTNQQNYAYIKDSDKKIYVKIANGTEVATSVAMSWSQYDEVEVFLAAGSNNASDVRYRVNGGSWTPLSLPTVSNIPAPGINPVAIFYNDYVSVATNDTGQLPCWLHRVTFYRANSSP